MQECTDRDPELLEWTGEVKTAREAFENWVSQFDTEGNTYMDMGVDEFFGAGYQSRQPEIDALKADLIVKLRLCVNLGETVDALKAENEKLRKDAERFRWLCEDHNDAKVRQKRNRILDCFSVHSYSASCLDIDAAMTAPDTEVRDA